MGENEQTIQFLGAVPKSLWSWVNIAESTSFCFITATQGKLLGFKCVSHKGTCISLMSRPVVLPWSISPRDTEQHLDTRLIVTTGVEGLLAFGGKRPWVLQTPYNAQDALKRIIQPQIYQFILLRKLARRLTILVWPGLKSVSELRTLSSKPRNILVYNK